MMRAPRLPLHVLVLLLVGGGLVAYHVDTIWSSSVDLAHHYALVFRLGEHWTFAPNDPSLGEMNVYPRLSHMLAVLVGNLVGSLLLGMHIVALASLVLIWAAYLLILYAAPGRRGVLAALVLALLLLLNQGGLRLHGSELSHEYFLAQVLAQGLALMAIAAAIRLEAHAPKLVLYGLLLATIWVIAGVHLLPALELLGVLAGLVLLDVLQAPAGQGRGRTLGRSVLVLAIGIGLVVTHPVFATMRSISENNGWVSLGPIGTVLGIAIVCVLVLLSAASLLRTWYGDPQAYRMYKYLGLYGAVVASLCLLQMVLRYFDLGSDYAVKKYSAGLSSFLVVRIALWGSGKLDRYVEGRASLARLVDRPALALLVLALALTSAFNVKRRSADDLDTQSLVAIERQLTALPATALAEPPAGKVNAIVDLEHQPPVVNYMFSIAAAHTPRGIAVVEMTSATLGPLERYGVIVAPRNAPRFAAAAACATTHTDGPLAAFDAACLNKAAPATALR